MDKFEYENKYYDKGFKIIAGVDEVGRGPLAGPVVCAAVIMPKDDIIEGVDDSKRLSAKKRAELSAKILEKAIAYSIVEVPESVIDEINILEATKRGMVEAVKSLKIAPEITLIDGNNLHLPINAEYIIKGDQKSYTIGCASIIAKHYRDNLMIKYASIYPGYAFEKNKGYGSKEHIDAIKGIGPCKLHRRTFIKNFLAESEKKSPQNS